MGIGRFKRETSSSASSSFTPIVHRANASVTGVSVVDIPAGYYMVQLYNTSGPGQLLSGTVVFGTSAGNVSVTPTDSDESTTKEPAMTYVQLRNGATSITTSNFTVTANVVVSKISDFADTTQTSVTTYTSSGNISIPSGTVSSDAYIIGGGGSGAGNGYGGGGGGGYITHVSPAPTSGTHYLTVGGATGTTTWYGFTAAGGTNGSGGTGGTGGSNGGNIGSANWQGGNGRGGGGGQQPYYDSWVPRGGGGGGGYCGADQPGNGGGGGGFGNGGAAGGCGAGQAGGTGAGGGGGRPGQSGGGGGSGGLALRLVGSAW